QWNFRRVHGVFPRTGDGVPGADGDADGEGVTCGFAGAGGADAAGLVFGPGCVFGGAFGGFAAAAGWLCASESCPSTAIDFGVALGAGEVLALGVALPAGEGPAFALGEDAAIGPAAAGFLSANSASMISIA